MKILVVVKERTGGVDVVINNISKELRKKGHEVHVLSRKDDLRIDSNIKSIFPLRRKIKELMKNERYNIIYTQDWSMAFPLLFPFPLYKYKHFCCFHGNQLGYGRYIQQIIGMMIGKKLFVVGDSLKKRFPKSNLVYNGINTGEFRPLNKKREYIGWMNKKTELLTKEKFIHLVYKLELKPIIAENIPADKMNEFYNKCKIFVSIPPYSAGFNMCWLEAMAAGVPKIIGNNEGIGFALPIDKVKNPGELENAILSSKEKDYRKFLDNKFSWKEHVNKLLYVWSK